MTSIGTVMRGCDPRRVSFIDARDVLRHAGRDDVIPMLLYSQGRRDEPRVIKRRKDRYNVTTQPRPSSAAQVPYSGSDRNMPIPCAPQMKRRPSRGSGQRPPHWR